MLYILKQSSAKKWNQCQNDDSKSVYGGTKSSVFVSDEKVQANQVAFIFSIIIYFLPQKNSLFTSEIHYLWNGIINFESVIL